MSFDTAANIINDAAAELSLQSSSVAAASMYSSTDVHVVLLRTLLKGLGQDLAREWDWPTLTKTHTLSTADGTAAYDPPSDYLRQLNQTHWNRTDQRPVLGPTNAQGWQYLKGVSNSLAVDAVFRIFNHQINIHPTPSAIETVAFEYVSSYWVRRNWQPDTAYVVGDVVVNDTAKVYTADTAGTSASSGGPAGTGTNITDGTARWDYTTALAGAHGTIAHPTWGGDLVLFDRRLMVTGLKYRYLAEKKLPADSALADFEAQLKVAKSADGAAPMLSLSGKPYSPKSAYWNIPDTGYGT